MLFDALQLAILPAVDPGYRALAEIFQFKRLDAQLSEIVLWLATDQGAQRVVLPAQESVAFIPREFQSQVSELLKDERQLRIQPLELKDFRQRPVAE
jgi:predicted  nucleic acid-binding Zn ribbon protein